MVQFEINIKLSTINRKGLHILIARKETKTQLSQRDRAAGWEGGLDTTYAVHLIIEHFFSLGVMVEALRSNFDRKYPFFDAGGEGQFGPKFQVEGDVPTNHPSCRKTRWIDFSYGIRMSTELSFALSQFMHLTDRQRDGQTALRSLRPRCIQCSAVMSVHWRHTLRSDEEKDM